MAAALGGYLLTGFDYTPNQHDFSFRETGLLIMGCLYVYGAGAFLYARKDQLFPKSAIFNGESNGTAALIRSKKS